jgi:hypothetical protein
MLGCSPFNGKVQALTVFLHQMLGRYRSGSEIGQYSVKTELRVLFSR